MSNTYVYNEYDLIILDKAEGQSEFNGILKNTFEYDKNNNWIKCITYRYGSYWRTSYREIEYY